MTCTLCDKPAHARGLCGTHYARWRRHGDQKLHYPRMEDPTCTLCDKPAHARGLCDRHYSRWRRHGDQELRYQLTPTPTYSGVHQRVRKELGRAADYPCADCGQSAREWTYRHGGGGMPYSTNLDDYEPRCMSCHRKLDRPRPLCSVDGCGNPHHAKGLCRRHRYQQRQALRSATPPRKENQL